MNILNFREAQSQFHKKLKTEKEQTNLSKGKNILEKPKVTPKKIKMVTKVRSSFGVNIMGWKIGLLFLEKAAIKSEHLELDTMNALESGDHLEYQSKGVLKKLIDATELNSYLRTFGEKNSIQIYIQLIE